MLKKTEVEQLRQSLRNDLLPHLPEWQLAAMFVAPERYRIPGAKYHGRNDKKIIKNVAGRCLRTFTSGMSNGAFPKTRPWAKLTVNDDFKTKSGSVRKELSAREGIVNNHLQVSNFYRVMPMGLKDIGLFSNCAFAMLPHPRFGFYFYPFAMGTYAYACDVEGNVNMFTRDFTYTVRQVVENYATKNGSGHIDWSNIPNWVKQHWDSARYLETIVLTQVIVPNSEYNPKKVSLNPADKKFTSYTFVQTQGTNLPPQTSSGFRNEANVGTSEFLKVGGFDYFPVIIGRWEVQAEENYGHAGPTQMALSDVMTLQEMEKFRMEAVAKMVKPPMVGHSSMKRHMASILAGGITYVDDNGAQHGFKPAFELDPKLAELIADQREYSDAIRSAYFEDLFLMLSGSETKTHVSAREIDEKTAERMATMSPVMSQFDIDVGQKIWENAQIILEASGRMPPKSPALKGLQVRPEYISILAQASKVSMMTSLERTLTFATSVSNAVQDPALLRIIKGEEAIRLYADWTALDPALINDEDEFEQIKSDVANKQSLQLEQSQQAQAAETAKNMSQAELGKGSLLDTMMSAAQA